MPTLIAEPTPAHALLDSGHGRKLERYGAHTFVRPETSALWAPAAPDWQADGEFIGGSDEDGGGRWHLSPTVPASFPLAHGAVRFHAAPTPFRHLAFFPDMAPQWDWMRGLTRPHDEILNLFGYTGVASLILADAGARVTHLDASRKAVAAAQANAQLSDLTGIRWLTDDASKFAAREVRRGRRYDGILLDPPKFGRGPEGEVWRIEEHLLPLVSHCAALLDAHSRFLVLTAYAIRLSALTLGELLRQVLAHLPGHIETGEMTLREEARGLLLPTAIFARWSNPAAAARPVPGPVAQG